MSRETKTTAEAVEKAEAKKFEAAQVITEAVAYIGPTIKGVAVNGTVFSNGTPAGLNDKIAEVPAIKGLLIPVSKLAAANVAIHTEGTALNTLYETVAAKLQ